MKKRIISVIAIMFAFCSVFYGVFVEASASDAEKEKIVDGSYLTKEESSKGYSKNNLIKGKHMMDGECSITKAGLTRVYCYGATTGYHVVDYIAVIVYVEQYNEEGDFWGRIDSWMESDKDTYYVSTGKTIKVDRGYYYRVRADHFVEKKPDPMEDTFSVTNGILVPAP